MTKTKLAPAHPELEYATLRSFRRGVDIQFLKPLALWYMSGAGRDLPPRVVNALDSLAAYFEGGSL